MAARKTVLDHAGDAWTVFDARETPHDFPVLLGLRLGERTGPGGAGRTRVILTPELAAYLEARWNDPKAFDLPLASKAVVRLRRKLGHHRRRDQSARWDSLGDLSKLTGSKIAARLGVQPHHAVDGKRDWVGRKYKPEGW